MVNFLRNLALAVLPLVLRLIATQIEEFFNSEGGDKE